MSEELDTKPHYIPTDEEVRAGGFSPERLDPLLTPEEVEALKAQGDKSLPDPVPQYAPVDLEEFKDWQNNFYSFFRGGGGFDLGKRRFKAFQRLTVLDPSLVDQLYAEMADFEAHKDETIEFSDSLWKKLYQAYQEMATLVDKSDCYVVREDGQPDIYFLKR